jgi:hypothetical protein
MAILLSPVIPPATRIRIPEPNFQRNPGPIGRRCHVGMRRQRRDSNVSPLAT